MKKLFFFLLLVTLPIVISSCGDDKEGYSDPLRDNWTKASTAIKDIAITNTTIKDIVESDIRTNRSIKEVYTFTENNMFRVEKEMIDPNTGGTYMGVDWSGIYTQASTYIELREGTRKEILSDYAITNNDKTLTFSRDLTKAYAEVYGESVTKVIVTYTFSRGARRKL